MCFVPPNLSTPLHDRFPNWSSPLIRAVQPVCFAAVQSRSMQQIFQSDAMCFVDTAKRDGGASPIDRVEDFKCDHRQHSWIWAEMIFVIAEGRMK